MSAQGRDRGVAGEEAAARRAMTWAAPFGELSVGQRFESDPRQVSEEDVLAFCALTGDWHPQHSDARWAASSPFGERIAHGMLVLSFAVGLVPLDPQRVKALRRVSDVVFKRPVKLGEEISVAGEVSGVKRVDPAAGLVDFRWSIANGDGALVCRAYVQVLWGDERVDGVSGGGRDDVANGVSGGGRDDVANGVSGDGRDHVANGVSGGARRLRDEPFWREAVPDAATDRPAAGAPDFVPVPM